MPLREWPYGLLAQVAPRSGSGATSRPSRAATPSPSACCDEPAPRPGPHRRRPARRAAVDLAALEADLLADDTDETTLVIGYWSYAGTGWDTDGDTELARAAAARAREYAQHRAEQKRRSRRRVEGEGVGDDGSAEDPVVVHRGGRELPGRAGSNGLLVAERRVSARDARVGKRLRCRPQDVNDWVSALPTEVAA